MLRHLSSFQPHARHARCHLKDLRHRPQGITTNEMRAALALAMLPILDMLNILPDRRTGTYDVEKFQCTVSVCCAVALVLCPGLEECINVNPQEAVTDLIVPNKLEQVSHNLPTRIMRLMQDGCCCCGGNCERKFVGSKKAFQSLPLRASLSFQWRNSLKHCFVYSLIILVCLVLTSSSN